MDFFHFPFERIYDANSIASNGMETEGSKYKTTLSSSTIFITALSFEWRPLYVWGLEQLPYCFLSEKVFHLCSDPVSFPYIFMSLYVCMSAYKCKLSFPDTKEQGKYSLYYHFCQFLTIYDFFKFEHWRPECNNRSFVKMVRKEGMGIFTCR